MIPVKVNGAIMAWASDEEEAKIYRLFCAGMKADEIVSMVGVSPDRVKSLTQMGER